MKKKIYSAFLIAAVAIMASSCNGCGGKTNSTGSDSTAKDSSAKDSTQPKPVHNKLNDSTKKQDSLAKDSTQPKTGPKKKAPAKAN